MKYILDCVNERGLQLELNPEAGYLCLTICNEDENMSIYFTEKEVFELVGALHHIQKQLIVKK